MKDTISKEVEGMKYHTRLWIYK